MDARRFSTRQGCRVEKSRRRSGPGVPQARRARRQGVLSLGHVSLHEQRKVARAPKGSESLCFRFCPCSGFLWIEKSESSGRPCQNDGQERQKVRGPKSQSQRARAKESEPKSQSQRARDKARSGSLKAELSPLLRRSELLLFARAKRSNQEKARPCLRAQPAARAGSTPPAGFFDETSCLVEKRRTSMCVALRVFPAGSVAAEGGPEGKSQGEGRINGNGNGNGDHGSTPRRTPWPRIA